MTEMRSLSDVYSDICSENVNKGISRLRVRLFNYTCIACLNFSNVGESSRILIYKDLACLVYRRPLLPQE